MKVMADLLHFPFRAGAAACPCWTATPRQVQTWLGPAGERLDSRQLYRFIQAWHDIGQHYRPDERAEAHAALQASVDYLLGDITPELAHRRAAQAVAAARQVVAMAAEDCLPGPAATPVTGRVIRPAGPAFEPRTW